MAKVRRNKTPITVTTSEPIGVGEPSIQDAFILGPVLPKMPLKTPAPWMDIARAEIGVREVNGRGSNPRVEEYLRTAARVPGATDEIPWCAAFVGWVLLKAGLTPTGKLSARSYMDWGRPLDIPAPGCIVVLWREDPKGYKGHIGFLVCEEVIMGKHHVVLLGGNQTNRVREAAFPATRVLGYRWPT